MTNPSPVLRDALVQQLTQPNPKFTELVNMGKSTYKVPEFLVNFEVDANDNMIIPRGMRAQLFGLMEMFAITAEFIDQRRYISDMRYVDSNLISYRTYQKPAIQGLVSGGTEGILIAPPGSGKTVMGLSLIPIYQQPTLWLTHTDRLMKQSISRSKQFLGLEDEDIGVIGAGSWKIGKVLTVGMIQTLVRNLERLHELLNQFGMVIVDECHHVPASTFSLVLSELNPYYMYGLTATPRRRDRLESLMFQNLGSILSEITKKEVAEQGGIIAPTIVYTPLYHTPQVDESNVSNIFNNYIIYNVERNKRIKNDVVREAKAGKFCIVASGRRNHCDMLYEIIKREWPKTGIATGKYSKKKVDEQVEAFDSNEITVLVTTPDLLGEGFDVDFLDRLFIATSFRTESRVEQLIGRIQRFHPEKENAIVYEYVDANIGVFVSQYYSKWKDCRSNVYKRLGLNVISYDEYLG